MLTHVKTYLGVATPDLKLFLAEQPWKGDHLCFALKWSSNEARTIQKVRIRLVEEYRIGRWKRSNRQSLFWGDLALDGPWPVGPGRPVVLEVSLPVQPQGSRLDQWRRKPWLAPLVQVLQFIENVRSEFHVEVTSTIKGAALPTIRKLPVPSGLFDR